MPLVPHTTENTKGQRAGEPKSLRMLSTAHENRGWRGRAVRRRRIDARRIRVLDDLTAVPQKHVDAVLHSQSAASGPART